MNFWVGIARVGHAAALGFILRATGELAMDVALGRTTEQMRTIAQLLPWAAAHVMEQGSKS